MKKIIGLSLFSTMSCIYAGDYSQHIELTDGQKYEYFVKQGLPIPGSGVHLIPASDMDKTAISDLNKNSLSMNTRGYIHKKSIHAENLLNIKRLSAKDLRENIDNTNPHNTHMHASAKDINTAYDYWGVPSELVSEIIGFSAGGSYIEDRGWNGAAEFFEPKDLVNAVCLYGQSNIKLTGGAANLAKEIVTYNVNKKVSVITIIGSKESAFEYDAEWFDENFHHELHCAQKEYNKDTINKVINMAKVIDTRYS